MAGKEAPNDLSTQPLSTQCEDLGALHVVVDREVTGYTYVAVTEAERIIATGSGIDRHTVQTLIDNLVLKYPQAKLNGSHKPHDGI